MIMVDPTVIVAAITGLTGLAGIVASGKLGTGKDRREAQRTLEAKCRLLEDSLNEARDRLRVAGLPVPPYPAGLTDTKGSDD